MSRKAPRVLGQEGNGWGGGVCRKGRVDAACGGKCAKPRRGDEQGRTKKKLANAKSGQPAHAIVRKLGEKMGEWNCSHGYGYNLSIGPD